MSDVVCPVSEFFLSGDREWEHGEVRYRVAGPVNMYVTGDDEKISEVYVSFTPRGQEFEDDEERFLCAFYAPSPESVAYTYVAIHFQGSQLSAGFFQTVEDVKEMIRGAFLPSERPEEEEIARPSAVVGGGTFVPVMVLYMDHWELVEGERGG